MFPNRRHLPFIALLSPPLLGAAIGAALATLYPPRHPDDRVFAWIVAAGGLGVVGMLLGFLVWLWLRGRVSPLVPVSAIAIPSCLLGWFINRKGGHWDFACLFGLFALFATIAFFVRSFALIGNRDGGASSGCQVLLNALGEYRNESYHRDRRR